MIGKPFEIVEVFDLVSGLKAKIIRWPNGVFRLTVDGYFVGQFADQGAARYCADHLPADFAPKGGATADGFSFAEASK